MNPNINLCHNEKYRKRWNLGRNWINSGSNGAKRTKTPSSWGGMTNGSLKCNDYTHNFASCSSLVHEKSPKLENARNSRSRLEIFYERRKIPKDNSPLASFETMTESDEDRTCYSSKTVKMRNSSNKMMVPNGRHCSPESTLFARSNPRQNSRQNSRQNKSNIKYGGPRIKNRENIVSTQEAKDRANKILCHYLEEWKRTDNDAKELNLIYQELMPIQDITAIIQKVTLELKLPESDNGEEKCSREEMRNEKESVSCRDLMKITSWSSNDHLRGEDYPFGQQRHSAHSKHGVERLVGACKEEGGEILDVDYSPGMRHTKATIVEPWNSFSHQTYNSQHQNKVKELSNDLSGNYQNKVRRDLSNSSGDCQVNKRNDKRVGHKSTWCTTKESGLLCNASLKAKEEKCRMLLTRQISRGSSSQGSQRSRNTQKSQNFIRNDIDIEECINSGGSPVNIEKRNKKCRVESANLGINSKYIEKDVRNSTLLSDLCKSQKSTNGRFYRYDSCEEQAQRSVSSRNRSRRKQKQHQKQQKHQKHQKQQKQQQVYQTHRYEKDMHSMRKGPAIDTKKKGKTNDARPRPCFSTTTTTTTSATTSRSSSAKLACHRLYDLSKSKRLEGKIRREEILRQRQQRRNATRIMLGKKEVDA